jgi:hypothetical protein
MNAFKEVKLSENFVATTGMNSAVLLLMSETRL